MRFELEQYLQTSLHQGITQISGYQFWTLASPVVEFQLGRYTVSNPIYLDIALNRDLILMRLANIINRSPHQKKTALEYINLRKLRNEEIKNWLETEQSPHSSANPAIKTIKVTIIIIM